MSGKPITDFIPTMTLNGAAAVIDNNNVEALGLTAGGFGFGSAFLNESISLDNNISFSTYFQFQMPDAGGNIDSDGPGGDGITFTFQGVSPNSVGGFGGDLGYSGINNSLAIEFDTWQNLETNINDPDGNHVAIDLNGNVQSVLVEPVSTRMNDGDVWNVWIDYNGQADLIEVRLSMSEDRPTDAIVSYNTDISSIVGESGAFIGFTGGAAAAYQSNNILTWEYTISGTSANDSLDGISAPDIIEGLAGNDLIRGFAGKDSLNGGAGADTINGGAGADTINGGSGADLMQGGSSADFYFVDNIGDQIIENLDEGIDTVQSTISYTLSNNVENLTLIGKQELTAIGNALNNNLVGNNGKNSLNGNNGADILTGNSGNDTLNGGAGNDLLIGGAGKDLLIGGQDQDIFQFNSTNQGVDNIQVFQNSLDQIYIVANGFDSSLPLGQLSSDAFVKGTTATESGDRFVYNRDNGSLYFDPDGSDSQGQVLFAILDNQANLQASNIFII